MPDPILRAPGEAPTALWLTPQGRLANACSDLPCDPCGPPPPPGLWVRGTLCACSSSDETEAWIRAGDLADLRSQGTCPTGRLPDGSCWEVLPGAEEREFPEPGPPEAQRLTPHGVGGCCVCCPGCRKVLVPHFEADACPLEVRDELREVCCPVGGRYYDSGYSISRRYDPPSGCFWSIDEVWWQSGLLGTEWVMRRRRFSVPECEPTSDVVTSAGGTTSALPCDVTTFFVVSAVTTSGVRTPTQPLPPDICEGRPFSGGCGGRGGLRVGAGSARFWYELDSRPGGAGTSCLATFDQRGFVAFTRTPIGPCKGRCIPGVLAPAIPPPPPGGGNSAGGSGLVRSRGGIIVPGGLGAGTGFYGGGCAGCGDDNGY